jgi:DNA-binding protein HU-beta
MNISKLVESVAAQTELSKKDTTITLTTALDVIRQAVATGNAVRLSHFGIFEPRVRSARKGNHPISGEKIEIPAARVPCFSPYKAFKEAVNR